MPELRALIKKTFLLTGAGILLGLLSNAVRPGGLPWAATQPYETFVPCPEPVKDVLPLDPGAFSVTDPSMLLIDARPNEAARCFQVPSALRVPFDYLRPVPDTMLKRIARSRAQKVIIFGDGGMPDNGHELARELAGGGIKNVFFVRGGIAGLPNEIKEAVTP